MKSIYKVVFSIIIASYTLSSCSDFLNQVPEEKLSESNLFVSKDDVISVLTQVYSNTPNPLTISDNNTSIPGNSGDEWDLNWNNYNAYYKDLGQYSAANNIFYQWSRYYQSIRLSMYFLNRIDDCKDPKLEEQEREWWKGEAYFLQAYYYFLLLEIYGPVPIIDKVYQPDEIDAAIATGISRATFDECVNHIDWLLTEAYNRLDLFYTFSSTERAGRASKASVKFLQARLWLYAASPLYNGMKHPETNKDYSYLNPKSVGGEGLIRMTADALKWEKAKQIAQEAIEVCTQAGLKLFDTYNTGYENYWRVMNFARGGDTNSENVYYRQNESTGSFRTHCLPLSWSGYTGVCPTVRHVNEYFMANGLLPEDDLTYRSYSITDMEEYDTADRKFKIPKKYTRRDPRFYSNILFPGQYSYAVLGTDAEGTPNVSTTTRWAYNTTQSYSDEIWFRPFYDTQDGYSKKTGRDYCNTGFLAIKFVGKTDNKNAKGDYALTIFRLAELYLNYTEAAFEYAVAIGENPATNTDVFKYWDKVRDRVQLPKVRDAYRTAGIVLTTTKLRELIHRERRVELAFEGHRYYDNRRWLEAEREGGPMYGMDVFKTENGGFWNENTVFETRYWDDKMYFFPISQSEIDKNPSLTQNARW
jgi:hypothetical protein